MTKEMETEERRRGDFCGGKEEGGQRRRIVTKEGKERDG